MHRQEVPAGVLSRLSHRPRDQLYSMVTISDPPRPVLGYLDFQSTTRFSRVSIQAKNVLHSLPAYRDAALSRIKLLRLHSASALHHALRSERCATCPEYGVYLFLPTCERCCWQCFRSNPTRRVVSLTAAAQAFALSPKMVRQLPVMFSIPGTYGVARKSTQKSYGLVSVSAAKELAMPIYGSVGTATEAIMRRKPNRQTAYTARYMQAVFSSSTGLDSLMMPDQGNAGVDRYFGMASIPFPSLTSPDVVEHGLWCRGCEWTYRQYKDRRLSADAIANMVPTNCDPDGVLIGVVRRARSRRRLSAPIRHCHGAQQLLADHGA
ncbi:F-box domain-containing protein [Xylaria palmicola]|nr:F-box domain-containing protein [Xylaria palmicola]